MAINPLMPPVNYSGMVPQINIGQQFAEFGQALAERQKNIQAQDLKAAYSLDLSNAIKNPTQETWSGMIAKYPQAREAFTEARKGFGEVAATNEFNQGFEVSMALENGRPDIAQERLLKIITARKSANLPTGIYQQTLDELDLGNTTGAQAGVNYALSMADPDRFKKQVDARTTAAKAPSEVTKSTAEASKAVTEAQQKVADLRIKLQDEPIEAERLVIKRDLEKAQAEKAQVDSKYANQIALADLEKKAAELGLTKAQTGSALAQTRKLGQETAKIVLELAAIKAGGMDPVKTFEQEEKLRKEFQTRTKVYGELGTTYSNIESSAKAQTGPGDIALITGFMKMLDPGSVVRETEFATARDTAGLYTRLENSLKKAESGQFLQAGQRNEFVSLAKQYLESAQKKAGDDKKALGVVVKNYKLNPENVFGPEQAPAAPLPASATIKGKTYPRPANFTDAQWSGYLKSEGVMQ